MSATGRMLQELLQELRREYPHGDVNTLDVARELFDGEPEYRIEAVAAQAADLYFDELS